MNLTGQEMGSLVDWATSQPAVLDLRLYGARAFDIAKPDSAVELCVTVGDFNGVSSFAIFFGHQLDWTAALEERLGLPVRLVFAFDATEADRKCINGYQRIFRRE
jgi:hypothetical protein